MSNYDFLAPRTRKQSLVIVEGNHEKNVLMKLLLKVFPEIDIAGDNILIFGTNIYVLYTAIVKEYGETWDMEDVDLPYLVGKEKGYAESLSKDNFNNILLVFDYERHDPGFSEDKICRLQKYFTDSTDVGMLYLNYPMIESYQHFTGWPNNDFENVEVPVTLQPGNKYKNLIGHTMIAWLVDLPRKLDEILEEKFCISDANLRDGCQEQLLQLKESEEIEARVESILRAVILGNDLHTAKYLVSDIINKSMYCNMGLTYYEYMRKLFVEIIRHNIRKARKIVGGCYGIRDDGLHSVFEQIDFTEILDAENECSRDLLNGVIKVLNTSVLFIAEYKFFFRM